MFRGSEFRRPPSLRLRQVLLQRFFQSVEHADALLVASAIGAVDGLVDVPLELGDEQVVDRFAYHCFGRVVIRGSLWTLSRPENNVLGPFSMRIDGFLPFYATYYLNGHEIIAPMLAAEGVGQRMKENAFVKQYEKEIYPKTHVESPFPPER